MEKERVVFLDWLRVIACFMVILTHSNEPVYLGGDGTFVATWDDAFWSTIFISLCRCCVPLFILASSYLLFPVTMPTGAFFKKRALRVGIPAAIWVVMYALFGDGKVRENLELLVFNFPPCGGHLWFCYMIIGLYLVMPLLSPWAEKASKKELRGILLLWAVTTFFPMIRFLRSTVDGSTELWGEANWSEFGMFYYVSGYVGYVLLGLYFKKFVPEMSWKRTLAIAVPCFLAGFAIAALWFYSMMPKDFPVNRPIEAAVKMEALLRNCTFTVLLMTVAVFLVLRKIRYDGGFYRRIILNISLASYGIYLMHIFPLVHIYGMWKEFFGGYGIDGGILAGSFWATPAVVLCCAVTTFLFTATVAFTIRNIAKFGKYIAG